MKLVSSTTVSRIKYTCIFLLLFASHIAIAQSPGSDSTAAILPADTTLGLVQVDSSQVPSSRADSGKVIQLEGPIYYWSDQGGVSWDQNKIYLQGNAKIVYQEMTLEAEKILIDQKNHYLYAEGIVDTVDSLGNPVYKGAPVFTEQGEEPIYGNTLYYDFQTKRGKINYGKTKMSPGYYRGQNINKISDKTMLVKDGYFTSCEYIDNPHFYFRSNKMRAMVNDRMIAQPVYLYIADVPVFVIPFGVFPNKRGRHSGLIVPNYGESSYGGRFLKNMGYYWVPSDYFDATFLADFYDDLGFSYKGEINYALRYLLNGTMSGYYLPRDPNTGQNQERWAFQLSHTQIIDPTLRISASGQFQSDRDIERDLSSDVNRRTNQLITSNLTISKSFRGTRTSMSVNANLTQNLKTGEASYTFPDVRFSRPQISLYELFTSGSMNDSRYWYQKINFTYNASMLNRGYKTLQEDSSFMQETKKGLEHNISLNSPQKVLKYFNVTPSINYRELWVNEITQAEYDSSTNTILESQVKQFAIRRIFNTSLAFKTTLYGLLEPNVGSLKFIRHKIDPQISYTYTPDFSTSYWDYFTNVYDSSGKLTQVDKFKKNPFGTTPRANESQSMRISISNLFQAKLIDGDKEKKIDLFTLNFSTGYNFSADSLKWQNLNSSFRSTPLQGISLDVSTSHSFYGVQSTGTNSTRVVDDFLLADGKPLRLLTLQAGTSFSLDNKLFEEEGESSGEEGEEILDSEYQDEGMEDISYIKTEKISDENAAKAVSIPWRVDFNISYAYNRTNVDKPDSRLDLGTRASITLTKNWRINWTGRFDLIEKTIVYQSFSIYRDLHCWEMSLNWQPSNGYYSFQINVKESILQDIKMTKHPAGRAYY